MVKKSTVIFAMLAMLAFGACTCWAYTVSQWPVPGIPNTTFGPDSVMPQGGYAGGYGGYGAYGYPGYYGGYGYPGSYYGGYYGGYGMGNPGRGWGR